MQHNTYSTKRQIGADYDAGIITPQEANTRYSALWPRCKAHNAPSVTHTEDGTPECTTCALARYGK